MVIPFCILKNPPPFSFSFFVLGYTLRISLTNNGPALFSRHCPILYVRGSPSVTRYLVSTFAFHFLQVLFIWREKARPNQGGSINPVKIYFYFDLSPWLFKGICGAYWFGFLSVNGKQRHFMKAVIILFRYRVHWSEDEEIFVVYGTGGFLLGNSDIFFFALSQVGIRHPHLCTVQYSRMPEYGRLTDLVHAPKVYFSILPLKIKTP